MASSSFRFELSSTQTTLAILLPYSLSADIDALRSVHDKAFHKWPPHFNIIYPFVAPEQLEQALDILRQRLRTFPEQLKIDVDGVDSFRHRNNAIVFMKPDDRSMERLTRLRSKLVESLGRSEGEGTIDGEFKPHLTIGQASLQGHALDALLDKARRLQAISWEATTLAVLRRKSSGEMEAVAELPLGSTALEKGRIQTRSSIDWRACYRCKPDGGRDFCYDGYQSFVDTPASVQISTWNLMSEPFASSFDERLPLMVDEIKRVTASSKAYLKVLCLQEVNEEILSMLLSDRYISSVYPYSTHRPSSVLPSERNLLVLASAPFRQHTIYFAETHKTALAVLFDDLDLAIINVHLTSGLTEEAIMIKSGQLEKLGEVLRSVAEYNQEIDSVLVGDFNIATSSVSIQAALNQNTISEDMLYHLQSMVGPESWVDTFEVSTGREALKRLQILWMENIVRHSTH